MWNILLNLQIKMIWKLKNVLMLQINVQKETISVKMKTSVLKNDFYTHTFPQSVDYVDIIQKH